MKKSTHTKVVRPIATDTSNTIPTLKARHTLNRNLLAGFALFLMTIIFYWPILSLSGTIWNDFIEQYLPYRIFATQSLKTLSFPFWNPYSFSGMPFFADIQSAVLYPLNLLLALLSSKTGTNAVLFEYQIVLHIFMAGIFSFFLARDFGRSRNASLIAALTFMFGGFATTHIFHVTMIHSLPWIPLSLFFLQRALLRTSLLYASLCGLTLSFISFAGHPQMILYTYYFLGAYLLYHLYETWRASSSLKKIIKPVILFVVAVMLGVGVSSVQLLPVGELGRESVRPEMSFEQASEGSFRPYRFITMLVPNYFGTPNRQGSQLSPYWGLSTQDIDPGSHYYWETSIYVGILPLLFSIAALIVLRSPPVIFLFIVSLISFLIALGESGGLSHLLYAVMPGFKMFRNPTRIAVIFSLSSSLCAAFGFDWFMTRLKLLSQKGKKYFLVALGVITGVTLLSGILFSLGLFKKSIADFIIKQGILGSDASQIIDFVNQTLYALTLTQVWIFVFYMLLISGTLFLLSKGTLKPSTAAPILVIITALDFLTFGYGYAANKTDPRSLYQPTSLIKSIHNEYKKEIFRFNSRNSAAGRDDISGGQMIFKRNEGTVHELFLMEGYNPLRLKRQLLDRKDKTLDILNVRYKIQTETATGSISIAQHPTAFPRAWFSSAYAVQPDENKILTDFNAPSFNHKTTIILEEQPAFPSGNPEALTQSKVTLTSWGINKIESEVESEQDGFLVLSEIYYPAWKALIDGKPTKLFRANYALRAIAVPAGKHKVVCLYKDDSFDKGLIISLVSLFFLFLFGIVGYFKGSKISAFLTKLFS